MRVILILLGLIVVNATWADESVDEAIIAELDFFQNLETLEDQELLLELDSLDGEEGTDEK